MPTSPSLTALLFYILSQKLFTAAILAYVPAFSPLRLVFLVFLISGNHHFFRCYTTVVPRVPWAGFLAGEALGGILEYVEKCLLSQWSFEDYGPSAEIGKRGTEPQTTIGSPGPKKTGFDRGRPNPVERSDIELERCKFGTWVAFSNRYISSPYQARNVPSYSSKNPSAIPSRSRFLLDRAAVILSCYLLIDLLTQSAQPEQNHIKYASGRIKIFSRLGEVTAEELTTRVLTSVFFWFGVYLVLQMYYSTFAFITVASGWDRPELWRPIFDEFEEAYTIRGFWGYTELSLTFVISGLFHQSTEAAQGLRWKESQATRFFSFMALGIILEDMVQWVFYRLGPHEKRGSRLAKALGYIWVLLYFVYATPYYAYPGLSKNTGGTQNEFLPLSILRLLRGR